MLSCFRNTFVWRQTHKWLFTSRMDGYYIYIYSTVYGLCSAIHNFLLSWQSKLSQTLYESTHTNQTYHGWSGCNCVYTYMVSGQDFYGGKILTYVVASAPAMTGSVLIQRFRLFLGQCSQIYCTLETMWNSIEKECQKPCGTVLLRKLLLKYVGRKI